MSAITSEDKDEKKIEKPVSSVNQFNSKPLSLNGNYLNERRFLLNCKYSNGCIYCRGWPWVYRLQCNVWRGQTH